MEQKKYKVWWVPQVPMKAFEVFVDTLVEAKLLLDTLAEYDRFQLENNVKPDYTNAGGVCVLEDLDDGPCWCDWYSDGGHGIDDLSVEQLRKIDELGAALPMRENPVQRN
jgi:hypothetical protein